MVEEVAFLGPSHYEEIDFVFGLGVLMTLHSQQHLQMQLCGMQVASEALQVARMMALACHFV